MPEALLFVLSEPGDVPEPEFHDWYDHEHLPARLAVPGIRTGHRYRALDGATPTWLAWYETTTETLATPAYRALRANRSPRERSVIARLAVLDRRTYALIDDTGTPAPAPPVLVATGLSTDDPQALDAWYREEHIPLLHTIDGWHRTRRYRLTAGDAPEFLALHEISGPAVFDTDAYRAATTTPRRARVMAAVTARERRLFTRHPG